MRVNEKWVSFVSELLMKFDHLGFLMDFVGKRNKVLRLVLHKSFYGWLGLRMEQMP